MLTARLCRCAPSVADRALITAAIRGRRLGWSPSLNVIRPEGLRAAGFPRLCGACWESGRRSAGGELLVPGPVAGVIGLCGLVWLRRAGVDSCRQEPA